MPILSTASGKGRVDIQDRGPLIKPDRDQYIFSIRKVDSLSEQHILLTKRQRKRMRGHYWGMYE